MRYTSEFAKKHFRADLDIWQHDEDMSDYAANSQLSRFLPNIAIAAMQMISPQLIQIAKGESEVVEGLNGTSFEKLAIGEREFGVIARIPGIEPILIVGIEANTDFDPEDIASKLSMIDYHVVQFREPLPQEIKADLLARSATGLETEDTLRDLAKLAIGHAHHFGEATNTPETVDELASLIRAVGAEAACSRISDISATVAFMDGRPMSGRAIAKRGVSAEFIYNLVSGFAIGPSGFEVAGHGRLIKNREVQQALGSLSAHAFNRAIVKSMDTLEQLVSVSERLQLNRNTLFSYADTDINFYAERLENGKHVHVYRNIDMVEGNTFVTVINNDDAGVPESIDAYIANSWADRFDDYEAKDQSPISSNSLKHFINYVESTSGKMRENELIERLETGRPKTGLVYSYSLTDQCLEMTELAARTVYLTNAKQRFSDVLEAMREAIESKAKDMLGTEIKVRDADGRWESVDFFEHLKGLKSPSVVVGNRM